MMNHRIQPLEIQTYVNRASNREMISFAAGLPDMSVLPIAQLKQAYAEIGDLDAASFQYQAPHESLKKKIQSMMHAQQVQCSLDEILITNGAQQALYLTSTLFLKPNASLIIEEAVYPGFLQITRLFDLNYLSIASSSHQAIDLNQVETMFKKCKPLPFFYLVCNGHNPQGTTLTTKTRKELAYLAEKYNFIVVEDDPYGYLNFSDETLLPMRAYTRNAIYIGSFSKIVAPAIRVGWIVGDKEIIQKCQQLKDMNDLYSFNPNHYALDRLLTNCSLQDLVLPQKQFYKRKRDCMINALSEHMQGACQYQIPQHGLFIWLELPNETKPQSHDDFIQQSNVLTIPASAFSPDVSCMKHAIRLSFSYPSYDEIDLGIEKISKVIMEK